MPYSFLMAKIATHVSHKKVCFSVCNTKCVIHYKYLQFIVLITYGLEYHTFEGLGNHSELQVDRRIYNALSTNVWQKLVQ